MAIGGGSGSLATVLSGSTAEPPFFQPRQQHGKTGLIPHGPRQSTELTVMNPVFRTFWHGAPLSPYEWLCLTSFLDYGFKLELFAYEALEVPKGVRVRQADDIISKDRIFFYSGAGHNSVSAFSNLFRYELLRKEGGCWVDADVLCLSADFPDEEYVMGWENAQTIGTAILRLPPCSDLLERLLAFAAEKGSAIEWGEAGPYALTRLVRELGLEGFVRSPSIYTQFILSTCVRCFTPRIQPRSKNVLGGAKLSTFGTKLDDG